MEIGKQEKYSLGISSMLLWISWAVLLDDFQMYNNKNIMTYVRGTHIAAFYATQEPQKQNLIKLLFQEFHCCHRSENTECNFFVFFLFPAKPSFSEARSKTQKIIHTSVKVPSLSDITVFNRGFKSYAKSVLVSFYPLLPKAVFTKLCLW